MTKKQREKAAKFIYEKSSATGIGIISAAEIDNIGISEAVKKAMLLALQEVEKKLGEHLSFVLVDGSKTLPLEKYTQERILKGGLYHYTISAASVIAKVARDQLMRGYAKTYPQYGFENHVGYGTKQHYNALKEFGPCPIHRMSFTPLSSILLKTNQPDA
jgi:ribonuclease HII